MRKKLQIVAQTRVIVDSREASLDIRMPLEEVRKRYSYRHLTFDATNGQYAVPENGKRPEWSLTFPRW